MKTIYLLILVFGTSIVFPSTLIAGNSRSFFLGDEAAITAGAGIAICGDSGSLWYNPAGLGGLNRGRMELTGTVYSAKLRKLDKILQAHLPSGSYSADASANDFGSVPTSLVFVRQANDKISYGAAWYQTKDSWLDYRTDLQTSYNASGRDWMEGIEYHQRAYVYHIGPAVGIQLSPEFKIGAALYFVYSNFNANARVFAGIKDSADPPLDDEVAARSAHASLMDLGLMVTAGIQWQMTGKWHLGVMLRTPTFRAWQSSDTSNLDLGSNVTEAPATSFFDYQTETDSSMTFKQTVPMEAQVGIVYKSGRNWIGVEGAVRPPLDSRNQKLLWNASLGGRLALNSVTSWGAGLFTDNSAEKRTDDLISWRTDRYGFTTGLEFKTPLMARPAKKQEKSEKTAKEGDAAQETAEPKPEERPLVWATTIAVSYSFELAEYKSIVYDDSLDDPFFAATQKGVFHHGFAYMGTALYF